MKYLHVTSITWPPPMYKVPQSWTSLKFKIVSFMKIKVIIK